MLNKKRPIDKLFNDIYSWWDKSYVFIKKEKIKLAYFIFSAAFIAGLVSALAWSVAVDIHQSSKACGPASLFLEPASLTVNKGGSFNLNVKLNTRDLPVVVARAIIKYNPSEFSLVSYNTSNSDFAQGNTCQYNGRACEIINNNITAGIIDITLAKPNPGVNTYDGLIATLTFKALSSVQPVNPNIIILFNGIGRYDDSDAISKSQTGNDILDSVSNATVKVNATISGKTYYVCNSATTCNNGSSGWSTGNDANNGTAKATPFASIQKAADVMVPGDVVIVGNGEYHRTGTNTSGLVSIVYNKGGTADNPKTFKSENKYGAVLVGTNPSTSAGFFLYGTGTDYIHIEGFEMKNFTSSGGISIQGGNYFANNITVKNNYFHDNGRVLRDSGVSGTGVVSGTGNNWLVDGNIFYNNGRLQHTTCVPASPCPYSTDTNQDHDIYMQGNNNTFRNNLFYGVHGGGWNIQFRGSKTTNVKIINNTFAGYNPYNTGNIILWEAQTGTLIQNNIFSNPSAKAALRCYGSGTTVANNNLVAAGLPLVNSECNGGGKGTVIASSTITGDPLFMAPGNNNYILKTGSPAIDKGLPTNAPAYDLMGVSRPKGTAYDIGAYEF